MTGVLLPEIQPPGVRNADPLAAILGAGWGFPVLPTGSGRLPQLSGAAAVRQSVRLLLATEPGERVMRPDFGCPLRQFLMAPNTPATRSAIGETVRAALVYWERRISVGSVEVSAVSDPSIVVVTVSFQHVRDASSASVQLALAVGAG